MNKLIDKGVEIIVPKANNIHVSGHPARDELKTDVLGLNLRFPFLYMVKLSILKLMQN